MLQGNNNGSEVLNAVLVVTGLAAVAGRLGAAFVSYICINKSGFTWQ
jgi:hypothetical protein